MKIPSFTYSYAAYALLAVAVLAWVGVIYEGTRLQNIALDRAQTAATQEQMAEKRAYASRLAALALDTKEERERIDALVQTDIATIANTIESIGKNAHVGAQVSDAIAEGGATELPGGGKLQPVAFVVQASGSFQALMRAAALYEKLSLPSQIEQLDIERSGGGDPSAAPWRMTIRIRVFTSAPVSS